MSQVKVVNNSKEVKEAFEKQAIKALTECGLLAEGFAIQRLTEQDAVKTGLLRNSITFGITGEPVNKKSYKADVGDKKGHYDSDIPKERNMALYVGTNVEYASYIEHGTGGRSDKGGRKTSWNFKNDKGEWSRTNGITPRPYIRPAIADHIDLYKEVIKDNLSR